MAKSGLPIREIIYLLWQCLRYSGASDDHDCIMRLNLPMARRARGDLGAHAKSCVGAKTLMWTLSIQYNWRIDLTTREQLR